MIALHCKYVLTFFVFSSVSCSLGINVVIDIGASDPIQMKIPPDFSVYQVAQVISLRVRTPLCPLQFSFAFVCVFVFAFQVKASILISEATFDWGWKRYMGEIWGTFLCIPLCFFIESKVMFIFKPNIFLLRPIYKIHFLPNFIPIFMFWNALLPSGLWFLRIFPWFHNFLQISLCLGIFLREEK